MTSSSNDLKDWAICPSGQLSPLAIKTTIKTGQHALLANRPHWQGHVAQFLCKNQAIHPTGIVPISNKIFSVQPFTTNNKKY